MSKFIYEIRESSVENAIEIVNKIKQAHQNEDVLVVTRIIGSDVIPSLISGLGQLSHQEISLLEASLQSEGQK